MEMYDWRQWTRILTIIGTVQFVILTVLAMVFYPGGTATDSTTVGYSFTQNFFSDLGGTKTHSGASNTISLVLFFIALTTIGILFIPYLISLPGIFTNSRLARYICYVGSTIGVFSAICYIGIAFTPWDIAREGHIFFVKLAFTSIVPVALCYTTSMLLEQGFPKRYAFVFIVFTAILVAYAWLMFNIPVMLSPEGINIQAVGQKIVVYVMNISFAIQAYGTLRVSQRQIPRSITEATHKTVT